MDKGQQIALITGCSRGIGYATVELLALHDFKIYAGVRSIKSCKNIHFLADKNPNIIIREVDFNKKSSIQKITREIKEKEEKIDVIVNNASSIIFGPIETINPEQFHEQFQVNLFGPILLTQELIPLMRKEKRGHIIFLGSTSGIESHGMYGAYAASKFALEAICHSLAVNLYPWNIHISIIELSATATLLAKKTLKMGSRMKGSANPYLNYTRNTLEYLRTLLINGTLPKEIAEAILEVILNPPNELRYFATQRSKEIFERSLKDPANTKWKEEAREDSNFYSESACLYNNH
jgi:NAD(P)-dependent dehydrogenase (short-subunit alcohol dehydrogenase family)